jgi:hypothetical protein
MPRLGPIKREDFIRKLRPLGFDGPFPAKCHAIMQYRDYSPRITKSDSAVKTRHTSNEAAIVKWLYRRQL